MGLYSDWFAANAAAASRKEKYLQTLQTQLLGVWKKVVRDWSIHADAVDVQWIQHRFPGLKAKTAYPRACPRLRVTEYHGGNLMFEVVFLEPVWDVKAEAQDYSTGNWTHEYYDTLNTKRGRERLEHTHTLCAYLRQRLEYIVEHKSNFPDGDKDEEE